MMRIRDGQQGLARGQFREGLRAAYWPHSDLQPPGTAFKDPDAEIEGGRENPLGNGHRPVGQHGTNRGAPRDGIVEGEAELEVAVGRGRSVVQASLVADGRSDRGRSEGMARQDHQGGDEAFDAKRKSHVPATGGARNPYQHFLARRVRRASLAVTL